MVWVYLWNWFTEHFVLRTLWQIISKQQMRCYVNLTLAKSKFTPYLYWTKMLLKLLKTSTSTKTKVFRTKRPWQLFGWFFVNLGVFWFSDIWLRWNCPTLHVLVLIRGPKCSFTPIYVEGKFKPYHKST